jgi:hypothetical protein
MKYTFDPYPMRSYYLFKSDVSDPIRAFELETGLKVNRNDSQVFALSENDGAPPQQEEKSWWDSFWEDGWSHVAFGTVSTGVGVGMLCAVSGPVGWVSGVLAISGVLAVGGGAVGVVSGGGQLLSSDPETKKLFEQVGDAALSANNIPGLAVGSATYLWTGDFNTSIDYANYAGLASGGASLAKSGFNAIKMQQLYNLEVGFNSTRWGTRTRNISATVVGINPKGLEGSHLIPQRIVRSLVERAPKFRRQIENLFNGPLGINFMPATSHALVDSYRFRTLAAAQKEFLAATQPMRTALIKNYPKLADTLGFYSNMSKTTKPVFNSLLITGGRAAKIKTVNASHKSSHLSTPVDEI